MKPVTKPRNPCFGSGPTAKRPGWSHDCLAGAIIGRSHRSSVAQEQLRRVIDKSMAILQIPEDYRVGIVPASDTGAYEMAMWSLLGARGVDVLAWESFSTGWLVDVTRELSIEDVRTITADYGDLPDLTKVDCDRDVVFVWNGTTSGVRVVDGSWIPSNRRGLTLCDATSAAFAMPLPWEKLDVATWSWQKVLGGEAQHGMIALSPRAVERLESFQVDRPLPKIFRMAKNGTLIEGIFKGETINTPSMLAVADVLDALSWAEGIGGLDKLIARSQENLRVIENWLKSSEWADFLAREPATRSSTSICLKIIDPGISATSMAEQKKFVQHMTDSLAKAEVAYDISAYRDAPPGLRVWGGATVETDDIRRLLPWLDWAFDETAPKFF